MLIVPSVRAESIIGLREGDTLPEVAESNVPPPVVAGVTRLGATVPDFRINPECTRYFLKDQTLYVVLVETGCDSKAAYIHGNAYAVLKADGSPVSRLLVWPDADEFFGLIQKRR